MLRNTFYNLIDFHKSITRVLIGKPIHSFSMQNKYLYQYTHCSTMAYSSALTFNAICLAISCPPPWYYGLRCTSSSMGAKHRYVRPNPLPAFHSILCQKVRQFWVFWHTPKSRGHHEMVPPNDCVNFDFDLVTAKTLFSAFPGLFDFFNKNPQ